MDITGKKIVLAGGSGFIGQELVRYFGKHNDMLVLGRQAAQQPNNRNDYADLTAADLIRTRYVKWDAVNTGDWCRELEGADLLVNLTGKSVNCRYTEKNKREIMESRTNANSVLGKAIRLCRNPPALWINMSSATIYRDAMDHAQDEAGGETGKGFSVDVCKAWENTFYREHTPSTRKVAFRLAVTLAGGGLLIPYFNLLKSGLGGRQGSGQQMFSWIHKTDLCRIIGFVFRHTDMEGTLNVSSPNPVSNAHFMAALRKATGHGFGLPAFTWMLRLGAWIIGTETELVLKSRWVIPARLLKEGFEFSYPLIGQAFGEIIAQVPLKQYRLSGR